VSSADGLDEISASGPTRAVELREGRTRSLELTPEGAGVERIPLGQLGAGTPERNAEVARAVLSGRPGAERATTLVNAGAALYVAGRARSPADGVEVAAEAIDSGAAEAALAAFVKCSVELAPR
jgi:anthranilate phosphoribosyltransferase